MNKFLKPTLMSFLTFGLLLACGNAMACQYGMDSSKRMDEVFQKTYPYATKVSGDGLEDTTFSFSSIFSQNYCPSNFRLSGHIKFIKDGETCTGTIVLKYRDHKFSTGKIRAVSCRAI